MKMETTMITSYATMLLFKQEYNLDYNDFYDITFRANEFKFQGRFNNELVTKLQNLGLVFIVKNSYVCTEGQYENLTYSITLT